MVEKLGRHAGSVVSNAEFERKGDRLGRPCHTKAHTRSKSSRQLDFTLNRVGSNRLGGVLHQIEENLDELIPVGADGGKRGVIGLHKPDAARKAGLGDPFHMVQHVMDVDGLPFGRPFVSENLKAVDEFDDPVRLVADQPRESALVVAKLRLKQLGGAADADNGFLISCASMAPRAVTDLAAPLCVNCLSILSAIVRS